MLQKALAGENFRLKNTTVFWRRDFFLIRAHASVFGAEIFSSDKAQILRPPGAYKPYVTKEAKAATQAGGKRSSQKRLFGVIWSSE